MSFAAANACMSHALNTAPGYLVAHLGGLLGCPEGARTVALERLPMFAPTFDPAAALAATACPRCRAVGLVEVDQDTHDAAPLADRHKGTAMVDPSVPAQCPACGLVMEWPGCCD